MKLIAEKYSTEGFTWNRGTWRMLRIIPTSISMVAMIELTQAQGLNAFLMAFGLLVYWQIYCYIEFSPNKSTFSFQQLFYPYPKVRSCWKSGSLLGWGKTDFQYCEFSKWAQYLSSNIERGKIIEHGIFEELEDQLRIIYRVSCNSYQLSNLETIFQQSHPGRKPIILASSSESSNVRP